MGRSLERPFKLRRFLSRKRTVGWMLKHSLLKVCSRGGRDGKLSVSRVYFCDKDLRDIKRYEKGDRRGSAALIGTYFKTVHCRRAALLKYFGEDHDCCDVDRGEALCDVCESSEKISSQLQKLGLQNDPLETQKRKNNASEMSRERKKPCNVSTTEERRISKRGFVFPRRKEETKMCRNDKNR